MSLVSHLHDGRLGDWCAENLGGAHELAQRVAEAAGRTEAVRPPTRQGLPYYAAVGGMFGLRLAMLVQRNAAPNASILGAVRMGHINQHDAQQIAEIFAGQEPTTAATMGLRDANTVIYTFRKIARQVAKLPVGKFADDDQELALLEPLAYLTSYEGAYRSADGKAPDFELDGNQLIADWRSLIAKNRLGLALRVARTLIADPASSTWGHASPTIVPRWAEADVILGPHRDTGTTLLDIKAVTSADNLDRTAGWLYQAIAYALLDVTDQWRVRRIGLWLARHGLIVQWPLDDVLDVMAGIRWRRDQARARLRAGFLAEARRAISSDYAYAGEPVPAEWSA